MNDEKNIYRYNDEISFRKCSLADNSKSLTYGDCTSFYEREENWKTYYHCKQNGIHFHCTKHPEMELLMLSNQFGETICKCSKCNKEITIKMDETVSNCLKLLNIEMFKGAKLIRLDDYYVPEVKKKIETESDYWINVQVKTDKDNDTIIVLYVGKKNTKEKSQIFIKPEKLQLSSDYKDLDPATILSKIEVTLKDRTLKQEYDEKLEK